MAPVSKPSDGEYDVVVIGGGSAGSASSVSQAFIVSFSPKLHKLEHAIHVMPLLTISLFRDGWQSMVAKSLLLNILAP